MIHVYDFEAQKILYSHDINDKPNKQNAAIQSANNEPLSPTINCIESNDANLLFVGLSPGKALSFNVENNVLSNKKLIFQCGNDEAINCMTKPAVSNHASKNNK